MPRNLSNVYALPPDTQAIDGDIIDPDKFNELTNDLAADLNLPRPIEAGGTGAASASAARDALGVTLALGGKLNTSFDNVADPAAARTALGIPTLPTGDLVGTTDAQTLTNKTLTDAILNGTVTGSAIATQPDAEAGIGAGLMNAERTAQAIAAQAGGDIGAQIAALPYGSVGTYVWGHIFTLAGEIVSADTPYAGSRITPAGAQRSVQTPLGDGDTAAAEITRGSPELAGTWRAMGEVPGDPTGVDRSRLTLFLRIS